jgi:hypothetical protein
MEPMTAIAETRLIERFWLWCEASNVALSDRHDRLADFAREQRLTLDQCQELASIMLSHGRSN